MTDHEVLAPAKVNLFLHVGRPDADGYHPIASLAVFADVGDRLSVRDAERFCVRAAGPCAEGVPEDNDNLVARAVRALFAPHPPPALAVTIDKRLPVAAGLGGGSSDAAALVRLLARRWNLGEDALARAAAAIGSDGAACLAAEPVLMTGRGERLAPAPRLPTLHAVLLNPRAPCSTGAVYRVFDEQEEGEADMPEFPAEGFATAASLIVWLAERTRNDLEHPAAAVQPAAAEVLDVLRQAGGAGLVRMSGSGATAFALFEQAADRDAAAHALRRLRPEWWTQPCRFEDLRGRAAASR